MAPRVVRASRGLVERLVFRRAPLAAAAVAFALGIGLGRHGGRPLIFLLGGMVVLAGLALVALWRAPRVAAWAALGVWVALGMGAVAWQPAPAGAPQVMRFGDGLSRMVRGRVVRVEAAPVAAEDDAAKDADGVPAWEASEDTTGMKGRPATLDLELEQVEDVSPDRSAMLAVAGGVRVAVFEAGESLHGLRCGDVLEMPLRMRAPQEFRDPGAFQYRDLLAAQGIVLEANVAGEKLDRVGGGEPSLRCRFAEAQSWAAGRLRGYVASAENGRLPAALRLTEVDAGMLNAMLFGERAGLTKRLRTGFERTGSFHLFVVSGLHIALLAAGVFWALRRLRVMPWVATILTLLAAASYAAITGFGQPAQRSLAMTAVYLVARLLARDGGSLNALGAAVLAMLAWSPRSLFEASLQMTVLAIVAIGGIAVPLGEWTFLRYARVCGEVFRRRRGLARDEQQFRLMLEVWGETLADAVGPWAVRVPARCMRGVLWALELALVGVVAELVMVLPMALYFHRAAVLAVPANMVVLPLVGLLLPAAVLLFVCALASPWLALLPGAATALLLHGMAGGIARISRFAVADVRVPQPVWWVGLLAVGAWLGCCWLVRRGRWGAWGVAAALPLIAAMVLWPEAVARRAGTLEVTAIDVGQGDSVLVVAPDGETMLVDAGGPVGRGGNAEPVSRFDVGEQVVAPYLWERRVRRLDVLVLTHAHTDHMGGMPAIVADFRPRELWVSVDPGSRLFGALLKEAAAYGVTVRHLRAGDAERLGPVGVRVLAPEAGYGNAGSPRNDDSLVMEMRWGQASVLLEGDAERPSEEAMLAHGRVAAVTLLKVGHHGSRTSSGADFLAAAQPREAVISVGRHNTFGHPRGEVVGRFAAAGVKLYRTDWFGLRSFWLREDGSIRDGVAE